MYRTAPINAIYRPAIAIGDGVCTVSIEVGPTFHHAASSLHGSVYFKMLDDAAFFAVLSRVTDVFVVTSSFHLAFLRPVSSGRIIAKGEAVRIASSVCVGSARLMNEAGEELARGTGDFARTRTALTSLELYRRVLEKSAGEEAAHGG
jgi:uncharacterized protein (TIGR00369 family)